MNLHPEHKKIRDWAYSRLNEDETYFIENHLDECEMCAAFADGVLVERQLEREKKAGARKSFSWLSVAASLILLASLSIVMNLNSTDIQRKGKPVQPYSLILPELELLNFPKDRNRNVLLDPSQRVLFAEAFIENALFESLISSSYRSDSTFLLVAPNQVIDSLVKAKVDFQVKYKESLEFELYSNQMNKIHTDDIRDGKLSVNFTPLGLTPGLYYWKIVSASELMHVGKFYYFPK